MSKFFDIGSNLLKRATADRRGATAVEMAMCFPFIAVLIFGVIQIGLFMYSGAMVQRSLEVSARDAAVQGLTSHAEITAHVKNNVHDPVIGHVFVRSVTFERYDEQFARIIGTYRVSLPIPFIEDPYIRRVLYTEFMVVDHEDNT